MEAQRRGVLSGIQGVLGSLLHTSSKFDIPVSTAGAGGLNKIVVQTLHQAEQAIQFLKENKIGRAGFFALEKIRSYEQEMAQTFEIPPGAFRVIDVLELENPGLRNLVFQVFRNTLIVDGLQTAQSLAYGKYRGTKVVTLCGKMIDESGLCSVKQFPIRGLVSVRSANQMQVEEIGENYEEQL